MGQILTEKGLLPDLMLTSPAKRALKTAKIIAGQINFPKKRIEVREDIYDQGMDALIELIGDLEYGLNCVFIIGHNPDLTDLVNRLSSAGIDNVPTCGIVSIEFTSPSWRGCILQGGKLALFERPRRPEADPLDSEELQDVDIIGT